MDILVMDINGYTYSTNGLRIHKVKVHLSFDIKSTDEIEAARDRRLIGVAEEHLRRV